jgi:hypothetical protein
MTKYLLILLQHQCHNENNFYTWSHCHEAFSFSVTMLQNKLGHSAVFLAVNMSTDKKTAVWD